MVQLESSTFFIPESYNRKMYVYNRQGSSHKILLSILHIEDYYHNLAFVIFVLL